MLELPRKKGDVSVPEALRRILSGAEEYNETFRSPAADLLTIFDILVTLKEFSVLNYTELLQNLSNKPSRNTLSKYISLLLELGLISKTSTDYRGAIKAKIELRITNKGRSLISVMRQESKHMC